MIHERQLHPNQEGNLHVHADPEVILWMEGGGIVRIGQSVPGIKIVYQEHLINRENPRVDVPADAPHEICACGTSLSVRVHEPSERRPGHRCIFGS